MRPDLCPSKSCRSSKLTPAARNHRPKVCLRSCTRTCDSPARFFIGVREHNFFIRAIVVDKRQLHDNMTEAYFRRHKSKWTYLEAAELVV